MHHGAARFAIARILEGEGFGDRALALALASALGGIEGVPDAVLEQCLKRSAAMPPDRCQPYIGLLNQAPPPADRAALCAQLAPVVIEHPAAVGKQLAALNALVMLWPHVASGEQAFLRLRFLGGVISREAPSECMISSAQLRSWQRELPTASGDVATNVTNLHGLLNETDPKFAYSILAEHLGINMDLPTLNWVIGSLSVQMLLHYHDPQGSVLQVLLGTVSSEQLCRWTPPEHLATLVSQQVHCLWWCRNRAKLPPVRGCLDERPMSLTDAVASGNITAAQRSARAISRHPQVFWETVWKLLQSASEQEDAHWLRALSTVHSIAYRSSSQAVSPDDAAAIGAVFADLGYQPVSPHIAAMPA
jgi:hypothetical protein